jgi:prepilin peptidase CpaA
MNLIQIAIYAVVGLALAVSVVTDLRTRKIRNFVTLPTLAVCLALRAIGGGWGEWTGLGLASGLLGMGIGGLFFLVLAVMGGMGGGDVKLVAAVGAGVGFPIVLACLVFIAVAGGVQAVLWLVWQGKLLRTLGGMARVALSKVRLASRDGRGLEGGKIPYGLAIAVGTVWGVWWSLGQAAHAVASGG